MVGRCAVGVAVVAALTVSLSGCLGSGGDGHESGAANGGTRLSAAEQALNAASRKAGTITSFTGTIEFTQITSGQQVRSSGTMAYRSKPSVALKMVFPKTKVGAQTVRDLQMIWISDAVYTKSPAVKRLTGHKSWLKSSVKELSADPEHGGDLSAAMGRAQQADPSTSVTMLTASKDVHEVGAETVNGVATTHYQGTYAISQGLAKLTAEQRGQMERITGQMGTDRVSFDVWVDGRQLPVKVSTATPPEAKVLMKTTMTYTAFDGPVSIAPPPASQIATGRDLIGDIPGT